MPSELKWISIEGHPCCIDQLEELYSEDKAGSLFNILIQLGRDLHNLRCGYTVTEEGEIWEIYGVWEGYDDNTRALNRNVRDLSQVAGQEYMLMYPLEEKGSHGRTMYESGPTMKLYRRINPEVLPLPAGTYYLEYEVKDIFERPFVLDRIEIKWDGEKITFPDDLVWEGTQILKPGS